MPCLFLGADLLLNFVDLGVELGCRIRSCQGTCQRSTGQRVDIGLLLTLAVVLEHGDHLIDILDRSKAFALALPDLFRVATALGDCCAL